MSCLLRKQHQITFCLSPRPCCGDSVLDSAILDSFPNFRHFWTDRILSNILRCKSFVFLRPLWDTSDSHDNPAWCSPRILRRMYPVKCHIAVLRNIHALPIVQLPSSVVSLFMEQIRREAHLSESFHLVLQRCMLDVHLFILPLRVIHRVDTR